jgi:4,5-dihydroxyphthalate decarboxylase
MKKLNLSFACWNYDRIAALIDGCVSVEGAELYYSNLPVDETFFRMARYQDFDVAEMSLSSYCMSLHTEERPFVAIPVFPSRFFRHSCIYVNAESGIKTPSDLNGKRVASPEYQMTAPVWIRGILQEYYGVDQTTQKHYTGGQEQPGRIERVPLDLDFVSPIDSNKTLSNMLYTGEIDALYAARTPTSFLKGDGKVIRLFPDFANVEKDYYRLTNIFPAMHVIVIRRSIYEQHRWLAQNLLNAFVQAQEYAYTDLQETDALKIMLPWLPAHIEETRREFGNNWWSYGIKNNLTMLETFCRYHHTQGLSKHLLTVEELFAKETLLQYKL